MDELSLKLLSLLKADGRMSVTALSQALGVSRLTVDNRIKRLEAEDIISGYTVLLGAEEFKHKINGWIMINVAANKEERAIKLILRMVEISRLHTTNGKWDLAAEIQTSTLEEFDKAVSELRKIDGIEATETNLLLSRRK
ncbi:transcriptional regulator [SAR116 cluster alpha proteobacterium HIMB100]|nr:transcriptional regulator [SAR116 cluster alpha proteobacterium HIMB100]